MPYIRHVEGRDHLSWTLERAHARRLLLLSGEETRCILIEARRSRGLGMEGLRRKY
jgi:hypothetical protein